MPEDGKRTAFVFLANKLVPDFFCELDQRELVGGLCVIRHFLFISVLLLLLPTFYCDGVAKVDAVQTIDDALIIRMFQFLELFEELIVFEIRYFLGLFSW